MKINTITPEKHKYLQVLSNIAKCPDKLYYIGNLPESRRPSVAIVGTRKPTRYGVEVTERLAYDLAKKGVVIVSGMALGIDGVAHRAAIEAGGTTIAVLANGLDNFYPASHRELAKKIIDNGGAVLSEFEPDVPARQFRFLQRNRIVSGLSDAVIITESAIRSGTLNTATNALEQGRDLFVVPGNITSPMSAGCNKLLQQGAAPVLSADDVLEAIAPSLLQPQASLALGNNPLETLVIQLLQNGMRDGDELQQNCPSTPSEFSQALTMLEIAGTIKPLGGNQWTLR